MSVRPCNPAISAPDAHVEIGVEGYYTLRVMKADADGNPIESTAREIEFKNLITNSGMDSMGSVSGQRVWDQVMVGSGNTPPQFTDTALASFIAATSTLQVNGAVSRQVGTSPRWVEVARTWRFPAGVAAGNLSEVGVRQSNTPFTMFSRALIVDAGGNPTTLTVLSGEVLDVTYRFRYFIPETDVTGTVTLNGTVHNWTLRPLAVSQATTFIGLGWPAITVGGVSDGIRGVAVRNPSNGDVASSVANLAMVAMDQVPTWPISGRGATVFTYGTYTPGSYFIDNIITWALTDGNMSGINWVTLSCEFGTFQLGFTPSFNKLDTQQLRLTLRVSWARRP